MTLRRLKVGIFNAYIAVSILHKLADIMANSVITLLLIEKGLPYVYIGILWSIYLVCVVVFDFPSGALADYFGRRKTYVYGVVLSAISYSILILGNTFLLLSISYIIKGIGTALMSGSLQAWLGSVSTAEVFKKYTGKIKLFEVIIIVPIVILTSVLDVNTSRGIIIIVIIVQLIISCIATMFMPDNKGIVTSFFKVSVTGLKELFSSINLFMGLFMSVFTYAVFTVFNLIWQPYATYVGVELKFFPLISALNMFVGSGMSYLVSKKKLKAHFLNNMSMILFLVSFLFMFFWVEKYKLIILIFFIIMYATGTGISFISISCNVNEYSRKENKATIFSLISTISSLLTIILQPIIAAWTQKSYKYMFMMMIVILFFMFVTYNIMIYKQQKKNTL